MNQGERYRSQLEMNKNSTLDDEIASLRPSKTNSCSGEGQVQEEVPARKLTL